MTGQDKFDKFVNKYPHPHLAYFNRPHLSRRSFFNVAGAGLGGAWLLNREADACTVQTVQKVTTKNTAKNVIFVLMTGAPSHTDTFDLKVINGTTPAAMTPTTFSGINWPVGLMPKMAQQLSKMTLVRSVHSWALVHSLSQTWTQIGRNPAAALGNIAPNIGSIVAIEKDPQRQAGQIFPAFLALNSPGGIGNGYLPANYAPFRVAPNAAGLPNTTSTLGQTPFNTMYARLHQLDDNLRKNSPLGAPMSDYDAFYSAAQQLMYNSPVASAFSFPGSESARYGSTGFGNACLVAKQVLAANQGTRFIQISLGNWDMHQDIYGAQNPKGNNLFNLCPQLDNGISALVADLDQAGLLNQTLIVLAGEFGRTVGPVTAAGGRDHFNQQSVVFIGGGTRGGKVIGATDATGSDTTDFGWSRQRYVRPEDVEATIYSALGIDWTTVRCDDPLLRGFEYVPFSDQDVYGPINELWA